MLRPVFLDLYDQEPVVSKLELVKNNNLLFFRQNSRTQNIKFQDHLTVHLIHILTAGSSTAGRSEFNVGRKHYMVGLSHSNIIS